MQSAHMQNSYRTPMLVNYTITPKYGIRTLLTCTTLNSWHYSHLHTVPDPTSTAKLESKPAMSSRTRTPAILSQHPPSPSSHQKGPAVMATIARHTTGHGKHSWFGTGLLRHSPGYHQLNSFSPTHYMSFRPSSSRFSSHTPFYSHNQYTRNTTNRPYPMCAHSHLLVKPLTYTNTQTYVLRFFLFFLFTSAFQKLLVHTPIPWFLFSLFQETSNMHS